MRVGWRMTIVLLLLVNISLMISILMNIRLMNIRNTPQIESARSAR